MLSDSDRKRLVQGVARTQSSVAMQLANWIADTKRVTEMVARGDTDVIPVFWIRLFGILADIADFVADQVESLEQPGVARAAEQQTWPSLPSSQSS